MLCTQIVLNVKALLDFARIVTSEFEDALEKHDWSPLYDMSDPNEAVSLIVKNVGSRRDVKC